MTRPACVGVDVGTSGVKVVALDAHGRLVAEASRAYPLFTPRPGWTEQQPADWLSATRDALKELTDRMRDAHAVPVALGVSGQMHGAVFLDAHGDVVRPALLWNDQRTAQQVLEIERRVPLERLVERTGNRAVTGFQLPKLLWLREHEPHAYARVRHVLLPKDYVRYALTEALATEPSDASGTGVLNLGTLTWDASILAELSVAAALFPEVIPSTAVAGRVTRAWASSTGLPEGLPVTAGAGDNAAAAIALGLTSARPDVGSVSLGTSGVIFAPLTQPRPDPLGRTHLFAHADGTYHQLGVTLSCAGALQWLRDTFAPGEPFDTLLSEAEGVPPGAEGLTFLPYLAGERTPLMNAQARGTLTGLSLAHGRAHVVRAVLEGTAAALGDAYDVIRPLAPLRTLLATGGGARSALWLGLVSGAVQLPVHPVEAAPGAAHGAAILAMPTAGLHGTLQAAMDAATAPPHPPVPPVDMSGAVTRYREVRGTFYPSADAPRSHP